MVIAAASVALPETDLVVLLLVRLFVGGPNPLDEEAAVKSAMGMSSLTSGLTIWSSNGCACLLSSIAVVSAMSLSGSSTSASVQDDGH